MPFIVFLVIVVRVKEHFVFEMEYRDKHFEVFLSVVADRNRCLAWKAIHVATKSEITICWAISLRRGHLYCCHLTHMHTIICLLIIFSKHSEPRMKNMVWCKALFILVFCIP